MLEAPWQVSSIHKAIISIRYIFIDKMHYTIIVHNLINAFIATGCETNFLFRIIVTKLNLRYLGYSTIVFQAWEIAVEIYNNIP